MKTNSLLTTAVTAFVAMSLWPAAANAEDWVPDSHQASVGGELYWYSAELVGSSIPIIPFLHLEIVDDVFLDAQLPFGMNIDGPDGKTRFSLGNPTVGARYAPTDGIIRWWAGGGISLPAGAIDDDDIQFANLLSTVSLGGYDSHLFIGDAFPVYLTGGIDVRVHETVSLQASLEPLLFIPVANRRDAEFVLQTSLGGEYRHDSGFGAGMDFKLAWLATESGDNAQALIDPYIGYTTDPVFVRLGLLLALDEPLGFGFDRGGVASPHVTVGGTL